MKFLRLFWTLHFFFKTFLAENGRATFLHRFCSKKLAKFFWFSKFFFIFMVCFGKVLKNIYLFLKKTCEFFGTKTVPKKSHKKRKSRKWQKLQDFFAKKCNFSARLFSLPFSVILFIKKVKKPLLLWTLHFLPLFLETIKFKDFLIKISQNSWNRQKKF